MSQAKAETSSGTATSNGTSGDHSGDKDDTFSATKTRFTCTTPSQSAARGLDSSLKEIDSKDRAKKEDSSDGKDEVREDESWACYFVILKEIYRQPKKFVMRISVD